MDVGKLKCNDRLLEWEAVKLVSKLPIAFSEVHIQLRLEKQLTCVDVVQAKVPINKIISLGMVKYLDLSFLSTMKHRIPPRLASLN